MWFAARQTGKTSTRCGCQVEARVSDVARLPSPANSPSGFTWRTSVIARGGGHSLKPLGERIQCDDDVVSHRRRCADRDPARETRDPRGPRRSRVVLLRGRRLAEYPDHARQAVEAGYHIGNHAYSHQHASELSVDELTEEVAETETLLEEVYADAGVTRPARLFRFPYGDKGGERADRFQAVLEAEEFTPPDPSRIEYDWDGENRDGDRDWYWTVSVEDWEADSRAELSDHVAAVDDRFDQPGTTSSSSTTAETRPRCSKRSSNCSPSGTSSSGTLSTW